MPTPIHPRAQELIDMFLSSGAPPLAEGTVEDGRARADTIPALIGPGPEVAEVSEICIPGPAGEIPARVYRPDGPPLATIVYLHGGGWVVGSLAAFDPFTRVLVKESGCKVVSVDYRLAPEHRFPCAVDDAFAALKWVASNEVEGPLLIGGDSAGGNLAAVCAIRARDEGGPELALQILAYPVTDHDFDTESYREQADNPLLSRSDMIWFWDRYVPSAADRDHADASPLRAGDLSQLPPAYVVAAAYDPLRDEVLAYAERLERAGVPVTLRKYEDQAHGFMMMVNFIPTADESIRELSRALKTQLEAVQAPTA